MHRPIKHPTYGLRIFPKSAGGFSYFLNELGVHLAVLSEMLVNVWAETTGGSSAQEPDA